MGEAIDNANGCALGNRLNECLQESSVRGNRFNTVLTYYGAQLGAT